MCFTNGIIHAEGEDFMDYNTMNYIPNGIIVSTIEDSKILYINKMGRQILKIDAEMKIESLKQLASDHHNYEEFKERVKEDNKNHGKSEGILYLKALNGTFVEISFVGICASSEEGIVHYIFNKATEVIGEKKISFKELADKLPSGIVVMDIENELSITYANGEHYKILGIDEAEESANENKKYLLKDFIAEEDLTWVMAEIYENFSHNEVVDIEFRMKTKGNIEKWVRLYGRADTSETGEKLFYTNLKSLSQRNYIHDKLHMERVLFHKMTELTDDILFRIDLKTNILNLLGNKNDIFGETSVFENYIESFLRIDKIHVEDRYIHKELMHCIEIGLEKSVELRYFTNDSDREFEWYKVNYSFIRNSCNQPISVVGKLTNIHSQKILEEQAKTDLLTHFYNKMTTHHEANRMLRLQKDQTHAFFIVDIDNFKTINDNLGHHFGDLVLSDIANDLRSCFRTKDILGHVHGKKIDGISEVTIRQKDVLGRIGGDEFIIVMRNVEDMEIVFDKAQLICNILSKTFSSEDHNKSYSISASVGISMYPKDGTTYEELYKKSDIALYDIKKTGKNGYKLYSEELTGQTGKHELSNPENMEFKVLNVNPMVISSVMNLLYETKDLSTSISAILMYLGNLYKVDRCYVFEMTDIGNSYENRFKWVREGTAEDLNLSVENKDLKKMLDQADENGVFYTNDIHSIPDQAIVDMLEKEKVRSLFMVESLKENSEHLILGLEDCTAERKWADNEVATLLHIGRLIFTAVHHDNTINKLIPKKN
ncbi:MAG: diguanylate cyclase [Bacillota bacterium]